MREDSIDLQLSVIGEILKAQHMSAGVIELYQKNDRIVDYLIDNRHILRISRSALNEQVKQDRVKSVAFTPKIHASGLFTASGRDYHFMITDFVQGNDLYSVLQKLTVEQSVQIGKEIAQFLTDLHAITDSAYDIGHYVPTMPRYTRSWQEGHRQYVELLRDGLSNMRMASRTEQMLSAAFDYIYANINCLEYQAGPRLLHNDLHPKNIIIHQGRLAGVIDWECSQFGEADFELAHLVHWCIYPPNAGNRFDLLLKSLFENLAITKSVPQLEKRLTIYQLEHELNQLLWNGAKHEEERTRRIDGWLAGQVGDLLGKW